MQLLIPAWDTCFWLQSPQLSMGYYAVYQRATRPVKWQPNGMLAWCWQGGTWSLSQGTFWCYLAKTARTKCSSARLQYQSGSYWCWKSSYLNKLVWFYMMININNIYTKTEFYRQRKLKFISASSLLLVFPYKQLIVNKQPIAIAELKDDLANLSWKLLFV